MYIVAETTVVSIQHQRFTWILQCFPNIILKGNRARKLLLQKKTPDIKVTHAEYCVCEMAAGGRLCLYTHSGYVRVPVNLPASIPSRRNWIQSSKESERQEATLEKGKELNWVYPRERLCARYSTVAISTLILLYACYCTA